ncbi:AraC family transcriptional regulator [Paenibacillus hemerocallicola]|uniref:AraC family transcriptional regulator n=1 Tax=Paenibacillus hemerocallicola TaxID=1172614 RepID=A0A5C4TEY5_9BACL|nr:AraC family transcriptional regulator [Paenibacillus hemerocallicola]
MIVPLSQFRSAVTKNSGTFCSLLALEQIAEECGFGNVYYFTRVFTKEYGMPPGKYPRIKLQG